MVVRAPLCPPYCGCNPDFIRRGGPLLLSNNLEKSAMASAFRNPKSVFVRAYRRFRFGRLESVCQHYRSMPYQYSFGF